MNRNTFIKEIFLENKTERVMSCVPERLVSQKIIFHVQVGNVIVPVTLSGMALEGLKEVVIEQAMTILEEQTADINQQKIDHGKKTN
jgi:hypothetical protein